MPEPTDLLAALRHSSAGLIAGVEAEGWSDVDLAVPSLCAGWTRGHVLAHLARNADGIAATLEGGLRGEIVPRYPDGWDARNAAIEAGAARTLSEQLTDLRTSAERLDATLDAVAAADAWDRMTDQDRHAGEWVWWRLREVEIHRVDLLGSYAADQWPPELIREQLPQAIETLDERVDEPIRVEVDPRGSTIEEFGERVWTVRASEAPLVVRGPDWAVLAWLVGRPAAARGRLSATPELGRWR